MELALVWFNFWFRIKIGSTLLDVNSVSSYLDRVVKIGSIFPGLLKIYAKSFESQVLQYSNFTLSEVVSPIGRLINLLFVKVVFFSPIVIVYFMLVCHFLCVMLCI